MTATDATPTTDSSPEAITDEVRARYADAALAVLGRGHEHWTPPPAVVARL